MHLKGALRRKRVVGLVQTHYNEDDKYKQMSENFFGTIVFRWIIVFRPQYYCIVSISARTMQLSKADSFEENLYK